MKKWYWRSCIAIALAAVLTFSDVAPSLATEVSGGDTELTEVDTESGAAESETKETDADAAAEKLTQTYSEDGEPEEVTSGEKLEGGEEEESTGTVDGTKLEATISSNAVSSNTISGGDLSSGDVTTNDVTTNDISAGDALDVSGSQAKSRISSIRTVTDGEIKAMSESKDKFANGAPSQQSHFAEDVSISLQRATEQKDPSGNDLYIADVSGTLNKIDGWTGFGAKQTSGYYLIVNIAPTMSGSDVFNDDAATVAVNYGKAVSANSISLNDVSANLPEGYNVAVFVGKNKPSGTVTTALTLDHDGDGEDYLPVTYILRFKKGSVIYDDSSTAEFVAFTKEEYGMLANKPVSDNGYTMAYDCPAVSRNDVSGANVTVSDTDAIQSDVTFGTPEKQEDGKYSISVSGNFTKVNWKYFSLDNEKTQKGWYLLMSMTPDKINFDATKATMQVSGTDEKPVTAASGNDAVSGSDITDITNYTRVINLNKIAPDDADKTLEITLDLDGENSSVFTPVTYVLDFTGAEFLAGEFGSSVSFGDVTQNDFEKLKAVSGNTTGKAPSANDVSYIQKGIVVTNKGDNKVSVSGQLNEVRNWTKLGSGSTGYQSGYYLMLKIAVSGNDVSLNDISVTSKDVSANVVDVEGSKDEAYSIIWLKKDTESFTLSVDCDGKSGELEATEYTVDLSKVTYKDRESWLSGISLFKDDDILNMQYHEVSYNNAKNMAAGLLSGNNVTSNDLKSDRHIGNFATDVSFNGKESYDAKDSKINNSKHSDLVKALTKDISGSDESNTVLVEVTGTLKTITEWNGYSEDTAKQSGYYLLMNMGIVSDGNADVSRNSAYFGYTADGATVSFGEVKSEDNASVSGNNYDQTYNAAIICATSTDLDSEKSKYIVVTVDHDGLDKDEYFPTNYIFDLSNVKYEDNYSRVTFGPDDAKGFTYEKYMEGLKNHDVTRNDVSSNMFAGLEDLTANDIAKDVSFNEGLDFSISDETVSANKGINVKVTGTLRKVEGWTGYSDTKDNQSGYYLPLIMNPKEGTISENEATIQISGGNIAAETVTAGEINFARDVTGNDGVSSNGYNVYLKVADADAAAGSLTKTLDVTVDFDGAGDAYQPVLYRLNLDLTLKDNTSDAKADKYSSDVLAGLANNVWKDASGNDVSANGAKVTKGTNAPASTVSFGDISLGDPIGNTYTVTGKFNKIEGWTGFDYDTEANQSGYYLPLTLTPVEGEALDINEATIEIDKGNSSVFVCDDVSGTAVSMNDSVSGNSLNGSYNKVLRVGEIDGNKVEKITITIDFDGAKNKYSATDYVFDLTQAEWEGEEGKEDSLIEPVEYTYYDLEYKIEKYTWTNGTNTVSGSELIKGAPTYISDAQENVEFTLSGNNEYVVSADVYKLEGFTGFSNESDYQSGYYLFMRLNADVSDGDKLDAQKAEIKINGVNKDSSLQALTTAVSGSEGNYYVIARIAGVDNASAESFTVQVDHNGSGTSTDSKYDYKATTYTFDLSSVNLDPTVRGWTGWADAAAYQDVPEIWPETVTDNSHTFVYSEDNEIPYVYMSEKMREAWKFDVPSGNTVIKGCTVSEGNFASFKIHAPDRFDTATVSGQVKVSVTGNNHSAASYTWNKEGSDSTGKTMNMIIYLKNDVSGDNASNDNIYVTIEWAAGHKETYNFNFTDAVLAKDPGELVAPKKLTLANVPGTVYVGEGNEQQVDVKVEKNNQSDVISLEYVVVSDKGGDAKIDEAYFKKTGKIRAISASAKNSYVYIAVQAVDNTGKAIEGTQSAAKKVNIKNPTAVSSLKVTNISDKAAAISWKANDTGSHIEYWVFYDPKGKITDKNAQTAVIAAGNYGRYFSEGYGDTYLNVQYVANNDQWVDKTENAVSYVDLVGEVGMYSETNYTICVVNVPNINDKDLYDSAAYKVVKAKTTKIQPVGISFAEAAKDDEPAVSDADVYLTLDKATSKKTIKTNMLDLIYPIVRNGKTVEVSYNNMTKDEQKTVVPASSVKTVTCTSEKPATAKLSYKYASSTIEAKNYGSTEINATLQTPLAKKIEAVPLKVFVDLDSTNKNEPVAAANSITMYVGQTVSLNDLIVPKYAVEGAEVIYISGNNGGSFKGATVKGKTTPMINSTNTKDSVFVDDRNGNLTALKKNGAATYTIGVKFREKAGVDEKSYDVDVKIQVKDLPSPKNLTVKNVYENGFTVEFTGSQGYANGYNVYCYPSNVKLSLKSTDEEKKKYLSTTISGSDVTENKDNIYTAEIGNLVASNKYTVAVTARYEYPSLNVENNQYYTTETAFVTKTNIDLRNKLIEDIITVDYSTDYSHFDGMGYDFEVSGNDDAAVETAYLNKQGIDPADYYGYEVSGNDSYLIGKGNLAQCYVKYGTTNLLMANVDDVTRALEKDSLVWTASNKNVTVKANKGTFYATLTANKTGRTVITVKGKNSKKTVAVFIVEVYANANTNAYYQ